jgi:hypothetical protein
METKTALVHLFKGALGFASLAFLFWSLRRRLIGLEGVVLEEVDSGPYALIMVAGQKWLALAADGNHLRPIQKGAR